jgi:acetyl esterase/lipase
MGHSAGAYNAAMLALDARWLAAIGHAPAELAGFIGLAGPYDFLPMTNVAAQPVFFHPDYPPGTQPIDHAGGPGPGPGPGSDGARGTPGKAAAPRTFLGAAANDQLVDPERNSAALAARLQAAGTAVTVRRYERLSHITLIAVFGRPLRWLAPVLDDVAAFIHGG